MTIRSRLCNLFASRTPRTICKTPAQFRPCLENLEDRLMPSTLPTPISGPAFNDPFLTAMGRLIPDSVTDPVTLANATTSQAAAGAVPLDSPWGSAVAFPEVPYNTIMMGKAVQPSLQLPSGLITPAMLNQGFTFATWFQGKNPGALLTEALTASGVTYQVPLVYINNDGQLAAGLFDQTPLNINTGQTILSWSTTTANVTTTSIGAANPVTSQLPVVDNTWHQAVVVFSSTSVSLYVDGLLQGDGIPLTGSSFSLTPTVSNTGLTFGAPTNWTVGGTIVPEPDSAPYPQINYPQGFIGAVDELAVWNTPLSQAQVQLAMTTPIGSVPVTGGSLRLSDGSTAQIAAGFISSSSIGSGSVSLSATGLVSAGSYTVTGGTILTAAGSFTLSGGSLNVSDTGPALSVTGSAKTSRGGDVSLTLYTGSRDNRGHPVPVTLPKPAGYFSFDRASGNEQWPNLGSGGGSATGTNLTTVTSTIPTDPFPGIPRLPGFQNWGLNLMMPLSAPSALLSAGTNICKVGLAAGDQLEISLPAGVPGTLTVTSEDDLGTMSEAFTVTTNSPAFLRAQHTGTYKLTLTWTPQTPGTQVDVVFEHIPGSLNSVMELLTSYKDSGSNTLFSYGDPTLPTINTNAGTGPANYWPLWTNPAYFPSTTAYTPVELNSAYNDLNRRMRDSNVGFNDFCDILGGKVTSPSVLQADLNAAYQELYGPPPQLPVGDTFFPVAPAATAAEAVYEFLSNADVLRQTVYSVVTGAKDSPTTNNLPGWVQLLINDISGQTRPGDIANTIATGQAQQVKQITVTPPQTAPSTNYGLIFGKAILNSFIAGLGNFVGGPFAAAASSAAITLANSFLVPGSTSRSVSLTVPVEALTNDTINFAHLDDIASSINAGMINQWNSVSTSLLNDTFAQAILSNFGLLTAFGQISSLPLSSQAMSPANSLSDEMTQASWSTMIPAVFHWTALPPHGFPTADGRTSNLQMQPLEVNGISSPNGIVAGDFNVDSYQDLAIANYGSSQVSILLSNGDGTFKPATNYGTGSQSGPWEIAVGDFNHDGKLDLAVTDNYNSKVVILLGNGNGTFQTADIYGLGPDADQPWGITVGDFTGDGFADCIATANHGSSDVSVLLHNSNNVGNLFLPATEVSLDGPDGSDGPDGAKGIVSGAFRGGTTLDLAVASGRRTIGTVSILRNDGQGHFKTEIPYLPLGDNILDADGIVASDFNHDGHLDLAISDVTPPGLNGALGVSNVTIMTSDGHGSFTVGAQLGTDDTVNSPGVTAVEGDIAVFDPAGDLAINTSDGIRVWWNNGSGAFFSSSLYTTPITDQEYSGIAAGDFRGNGVKEFAFTDYENNHAYLLSGNTVGNLATFLPGLSTANSQNLVSSPLTQALNQLQSLQSSLPTSFGPWDETGLITPATSSPPNYMAFNSVPYYPGQQAVSLVSPGAFVSMAPATLTETSTSPNETYKQSGQFITGWILEDGNNNPIALTTMYQLFGAPILPDQIKKPHDFTGVRLTPINPQQPFVAYNGGWYYAAKPLASAATTWAEAFFNWGQGTPNYSPGNLVPPTQTNQAIPWLNFTYTLTSSPAMTAPPRFNGTPALALAGPASGVTEQPLDFAFSIQNADAAAGPYTYQINWGDGQTQTVTGPARLALAHAYAATGTFLLGATVQGPDGAVSNAVSQAISVARTAVVPDPLHPNGSAFVVGGATITDLLFGLLSLSRSYDALGRLTEVDLDGIRLETFGYDAQGRLAVVGLLGVQLPLPVGLPPQLADVLFQDSLGLPLGV